MSPPKRILLTGANGFLGTHILRQLLSQHPNISVRCVVRSDSKITAVRSDFANSLSQLDFTVVPDITAPDAFVSALSDTHVPFDAVIHTASPFVYKVTSNRELLDPAVKGTTEMLKAVHAVGQGVKRVVITSSFAAVGDLAHMDRMAGKTYTEADWNPVTWEEALNGEGGVPYQGSKKFAEEAAWNFLEEKKPSFDMVTICPPMVYGPLEHTIASPSELNQSNSVIYQSFIDSTKDAPLPKESLYLYADPREVAAAHIAAVFTTSPGVSNQRFIVSGGQVSSQFIADTLRANFPELEGRTPIGKPGISSLPDNPFDVDSSKVAKTLGIKNRAIEDTFLDLGRQLLELERKARGKLE